MTEEGLDPAAKSRCVHRDFNTGIRCVKDGGHELTSDHACTNATDGLDPAAVMAEHGHRHWCTSPTGRMTFHAVYETEVDPCETYRLASALAAAQEREGRVRALLGDPHDPYVHVHDGDVERDFMPDCAGCWSRDLRAALDPATDQETQP